MKKTTKTTTRMTSAQIQKAMDAKITANLWDKETDRWSYMTTKQLKSRLFRITSPVKMEAFRQAAVQAGEKVLAQLAAEKRDFFMEGV